jgi:hypothetical protein
MIWGRRDQPRGCLLVVPPTREGDFLPPSSFLLSLPNEQKSRALDSGRLLPMPSSGAQQNQARGEEWKGTQHGGRPTQLSGHKTQLPVAVLLIQKV